MNILVINGSPKGKNSVTLQTVNYLQILHPEHSFTILHAGQTIKALERDFGSVIQWREKMKQAAVSKFGSGWAWLLADENGILSIQQTANQDVPDLNVYTPIFLVDVWEHAYYLQYQNRRPEYVDGWFQLINWKKAARRYEEAIANKQ